MQAAILIAACAHGSAATSVLEQHDTQTEVGRVRHDVEYLASQALAGRRAGTPGSDSAANFIASRLADLGLQAAFTLTDCGSAPCRRSYFQLFHTTGVATTNVGAFIVGTDSALRDEVVAITAHYDHLGRTSTNIRDPAPTAIHPGADDNASGTAAVLELARRLADRPPRRSVLILAFGAEELGLIGSRVFVEHPPIVLRRIVIALNLDMVGRLRNDRVTVYGGESTYLRALVDSANVAPRLMLVVEPTSSGRSDDHSFSSHGVPALHFTTGEHPSYHLSTDTAAQIEYAGMVRVIDLVERVARAAADGSRAR